LEPISYIQAIILGALQGISEPFPISSLGHAVLLPHLFGWNIHQNDEYFLSFLVATHCATALVLFLFFLEDWKRIWFGFVRSVRGQATPRDLDARLAWVIIIGTIPAGILGIALEHKLRTLFASPTAAAIFLTVNGVLLLAVERFRRRPPTPGDGEGDGDERIAKMGFRQALGIGAAQALALIPGISRSGVTMGGGLLAGLSNEDAARYAFLLATPIIGAAGLLKLPDLLGSAGSGVRGQALVGAIAAAITTWAAVKWLLSYFETSRLTPFGYYCVAAGIFCLIVFTI
jgi:undecaprenyl-diphosphatase